LQKRGCHDVGTGFPGVVGRRLCRGGFGRLCWAVEAVIAVNLPTHDEKPNSERDALGSLLVQAREREREREREKESDSVDLPPLRP
jgi:hypothetical protein